jgi:hypothetical protein
MRRSLAPLSVLALLVLGACAEPASPRVTEAGFETLYVRASVEGDELQAAASAHSNKAEPAHVDAKKFDIAFKFLVPPTASQRAVFEAAAARWEKLIKKDVPSISGTLPSCLGGVPPVSTTEVDDIVIEVVLQPIDGPGRILGSAGPCFIRNVDALPVSGLMFFDTADLAFLESLGLFDEVIVHEMGHVLGIGTLWNFRRTLRQGPATNPFFAGASATQHWHAEGGLDLLPIENIGGAGTAGGHWRESVLNNELMTGFLNLGDNPLSRITIGSLRDMGYGTNMSGEKYNLPKGAPGVPGSASASSVLDILSAEQLFTPIGIVMEQP